MPYFHDNFHGDYFVPCCIYDTFNDMHVYCGGFPTNTEWHALPEKEFNSLCNDCDKLQNRIYNLELYLRYIKRNYPAIWGEMLQEFDNLPDWTAWSVRGDTEVI